MNFEGTVALAALTAAFSLAGCKDQAAEAPDDFSKAIATYLESRGDLCLAKREWPIEVTEREAATQSRNALQMPVLERLGLVQSETAVVEVKDESVVQRFPGRRYQLTGEGRKYYVHKDSGHDLCVATLGLDRVTRWEPGEGEGLENGARPSHAVVHYTYTVTAAPWMREPLAARAFPAVARVLEGERTVELIEGVTLTPKGWVANDLVPPSSKDVLPTGARAAGRP